MLRASLIQQRFAQVISLIRLKPFDTSTSEGRSSERLRRVFWTAVMSAIANALNTLTVFASVPLTLRYLGAERYGLWMTITSVVAFLSFADLGVGNVLLNIISEANGKGDIESARKNIASAFYLLVFIALGIALIFTSAYFFINWSAFFNVTSLTAKSEAGPAVTVFLACFLVNLPLSLVPRIRMGYQQGYISGIWLAISNLIGLGLLFVVAYIRAGLPWLILTIIGTSVLGNVFNGIALFGFQRPDLAPNLRDISYKIAGEIIGVGSLFLILQVTNAITYSADNIIIAQILGPAAVTNYAVPSKLFTLLPLVLYMFLSPLWPAYSEAIARGDENWAKKTLAKTLLISGVLCFLAGIFLLIFGKVILDIWTGSKVVFSFSLMLALGVWTTVQAIISALSMFLNALKKIGFQAIFAILTATFSIIAKVSLVNTYGLTGIVWGNVTISVLFMILPYTIFLAKRSANQKVS
jgi:O-antigen/teichoic acid export membrane protein